MISDSLDKNKIMERELLTYHELKESVLKIVEKGYRIKEEILVRFLIEIGNRQAGFAYARVKI